MKLDPIVRNSEREEVVTIKQTCGLGMNLVVDSQDGGMAATPEGAADGSGLEGLEKGRHGIRAL